MDDKEYYSFKRITSVNIQDLIKQSQKIKESKYKSWENFQGREDAELLVEKKEENDEE